MPTIENASQFLMNHSSINLLAIALAAPQSQQDRENNATPHGPPQRLFERPPSQVERSPEVHTKAVRDSDLTSIKQKEASHHQEQQPPPEQQPLHITKGNLLPVRALVSG